MPGALTSVAPVAPANRTVIAHGTLTIKIPPAFQRAKALAHKNVFTTASVRTPAYVNPISGNLIDIYVDGVQADNLDGVTSTDSATITPTPDGTQTVTVPLYSTNTDIAAVEWDATHTTILALGETTGIAITPGTTSALTLTMQMNVTGFAISPNSNGSAATVLGNGTVAIGRPGSGTVYLFPIDPLGGFVGAIPAVGVGGLPSNLSTQTTLVTDASRFQVGQLGDTLTFATINSQISINVSATNPASTLLGGGNAPMLLQLISNAQLNRSSVPGAPTTLVAATLQPTYIIDEFALSGGNGPVNIVAGPDGALWFTEANVDKIGRITTAGVITEYAVPTSGSAVEGITVGPDNALWFTENLGNKIGRITTSGTISEYTIPTCCATPTIIVKGPDGNLWFDESSPSYVAYVTTAGIFTTYGYAQNTHPTGIAVGSDGNLWATATDGIYQFTTLGASTQYAMSGQPFSITSGGDGALWFASSLSSSIGRLTTDGLSNTAYLTPSGATPYDVGTGPDGTIWYGDNGLNAIGHITSSGVVSEYTIPTASSDPGGLTAGPDGAVWFTESVGNKIGRIH